jgi:hypothetical protein
MRGVRVCAYYTVVVVGSLHRRVVGDDDNLARYSIRLDEWWSSAPKLRTTTGYEQPF